MPKPLFIFSLLLIFTASCTISKRQHLSGYHVNLHPALKKAPSTAENKEAKEEKHLSLSQEALKEIVPLPSLRPGYSTINEESINLDQALPEKAATKVKSPSPESSSLEEITPTRVQKEKPLAGEEKSPKVTPTDPKLHKGFLIAAGILALISALFYALLINATVSGASYVLLFLFAAIGFYVSIILFTIALLVGLILYIVYAVEKA